MKRSIILALSVVIACLSQSALAQQASISGTVTDATGAVLPGALVTIKNLDTGIARTIVTDDSGSYRAPQLSPGNYEVRAELQGFQTAVRRGITLTVAREAVVDITLMVGELTEQVVVTGEAPLVEHSSSVIGGVVERSAIENLPLNGRGFAELALLQTNVVWSSTNNRLVNQGYGQKISISGMRPVSSSYTLDGQDVNDFFNNIGNVAGTAAGIEGVREFKVVTNPYSAEYGRTAGGEVQIVTKSGTNEFHGVVYEFHRNSVLDARNFFDRESEPPPFRRNQFGFAVGGPIAKNKSFFFVNYEGLRESLGTTRLFNVPDENVHRGLLPDPRTGQLRSVGVDPKIKLYLELFPLPNRVLGNGIGEFALVSNQVTSDDYWVIRLDHSFTASTKLYGRYSFDDGQRSRAKDFLFDTIEATRPQYLAIGLDSILSSRLINSFQLAYNRSHATRFNQARPALKDPNLFRFTDFVGPHGPVLGALNPGSGVTGVGAETIVIDVFHNVYQIQNNLTLQLNRHSFKLGANIEYFQPNMFNSFQGGGVFSFVDLEDFLKNIPNTFTAVLPGGELNRSFNQWLVGTYLQGDLRLSQRLTLNLGLRYEFLTVPTERHRRISNLRDFTRANARPQDITIGDPFYQNPSLKNFAPRFGLAWSANDRTAVRLGFGIFYDQILGHAWRVPATQSIPFFARGLLRRSVAPIDFPAAFFTQGNLLSGSLAVEGLQFDIDQPTTMQWTLNLQRQLGSNRIANISYVGSRGYNLLRVDDYNVRIPTVQPDGRLFFGPNAPIRSPLLERIRVRTSDASSFYHSFSASLRQRFSGGLDFQASYTLGKSIDDASNILGSTDFSNERQGWRYPYLSARDGRGLSAFDVRHNFVLNLSYELPLGPNRSWPLRGAAGILLGDWNVNALLRLSSGNPFDVSGSRSSLSRDRRRFGDLDDGPPNVIAGAKINSVDPQNPDRYFDPTVFALPEPGFLGNLGRHALIGPGLANVDFSIFKYIPIRKVSEECKIQFRAEFFNILNRPNFDIPSGTALFDPRTLTLRSDVGRITSTRTTSRQMQFGLKVIF